MEMSLKRLFLTFCLLIASAVASAQNCTINPAACQAKPVPSDCPSGKHWVTTGTGIAHCVTNDPPCSGTVVKDSIGEPLYCETTGYRSTGCPSGYSGSKDQERWVRTALNGSVTYGSWQTTYNGCEKDPEPVQEPSQPSNQPTNQQPTDQPSNQPSNQPSSGSGSGTTPPASDTPAPSTGTGSGSTGDPVQNPVQNTPPPTPTCSNGATNYPTCTVENTVTSTCSTRVETTYLTSCSPRGGGSKQYVKQTVRYCTYSDGRQTSSTVGPPIEGVESCGGSTGGHQVDK